MNRSLVGLSVLCVTMWLLVASVASANPLTVRGYTPAKHDRFYVGADKAFIGAAYDWSGIGTFYPAKWITMISPSYFITANHTMITAGQQFKLYYTNAPSGSYETATVGTTAVRIAGSDLAIGKLSTPISSNVAYYPILSLPNSSDYVGKIVYQMGLSNEYNEATNTGSPTDQRMGRNIISGVGSYGNSYCLSYSYDNPGLGNDECQLEVGCSGSPAFVIVGGEPALVGCAYAKSGTMSYNPLAAHYVSQINAYMSGSGEQLTLIVPEPSSLVLLIAMILTGFAWYGRRVIAEKKE